jgi:uncharacterized cupredoxin-like copper-binding protein
MFPTIGRPLGPGGSDAFGLLRRQSFTKTNKVRKAKNISMVTKEKSVIKNNGLVLGRRGVARDEKEMRST